MLYALHKAGLKSCQKASCQSKQSPETQGLSLSPFMGVMEKSARNAGLNAEMQKTRVSGLGLLLQLCQ